MVVAGLLGLFEVFTNFKIFHSKSDELDKTFTLVKLLQTDKGSSYSEALSV